MTRFPIFGPSDRICVQFCSWRNLQSTSMGQIHQTSIRRQSPPNLCALKSVKKRLNDWHYSLLQNVTVLNYRDMRGNNKCSRNFCHRKLYCRWKMATLSSSVLWDDTGSPLPLPIPLLFHIWLDRTWHLSYNMFKPLLFCIHNMFWNGV